MLFMRLKMEKVENKKNIKPELKPEGGKKVADVTKKVNVELEVDTSVKDLGPNPYARLIHMARAVDSWRIFPRIFITTYIYLLYKVVIWYMAIPQPTMEQSGLVSIVVGAGAAWFGLYVGGTRQSKSESSES